MKFVIDIPEGTYKFLNKQSLEGFKIDDVLDAVKNGIYLDSMLTNIKSNIKKEINEVYQQSTTNNLYYAEGLEKVFEIISKHIEGANK